VHIDLGEHGGRLVPLFAPRGGFYFGPWEFGVGSVSRGGVKGARNKTEKTKILIAQTGLEKIREFFQ
jgi:hypothetical protein